MGTQISPEGHRGGATPPQRDFQPRAMPAENLDTRTDAELIALYGEVMSALQQRGIVRSGNNPIADMAERIIADYYGVEPQHPNNKSFDVLARDGTKIEVKALRRTKPSRRGLSPLRTLDFDHVAIVVFAADMRLGSNRLSLTQKLLRDERVRRVPAEELLEAARRRTRVRQRRARP